MQAIIDFLSGIGSGISFIIDYISSLVSDLAYVVTLFRELLVAIPIYLTWLPAGALLIFLICYRISGVFKLLKM